MKEGKVESIESEHEFVSVFVATHMFVVTMWYQPITTNHLPLVPIEI